MDTRKEVCYLNKLLKYFNILINNNLLSDNLFYVSVPFAVEERSGVITVINELSKFERPLYDFEAVAILEKLNTTITTNATVHVVDVNDERGVFLK